MTLLSRGLCAALALLACTPRPTAGDAQLTRRDEGTPCAVGFPFSDGACRPALLDLGVGSGVQVASTSQVNVLRVELAAGTRSLSIKPKVAQGVKVEVGGAVLAAGETWTSQTLPLGPSELTLTLSSDGVADRKVRLLINRTPKRSLLSLNAHCSKTERRPLFSADASTLFIGAQGYCGAPYVKESDEDDYHAADLESPGAIHVLVRRHQQWVEQAILQVDRSTSRDEFGTGFVTSRDGDTLVASASALAAFGEFVDDFVRVAEVYVFERQRQRWTLTRLKPPTESIVLTTGLAISGDGQTLAVSGTDSAGARYERGVYMGPKQAEVMYVYTRQAVGWGLSATISAPIPPPIPIDFFPSAMVLSDSGDVLAAGAGGVDRGPGDEPDSPGSVYVFERNTEGWSQPAVLQIPEGPEAENFGSDLALSADGATLVARAPYLHGGDFRPEIPSAGALYVFGRSGAEWQLEARLKPPPPAGIHENFGWSNSMSVDGNRLAASYATFGTPSPSENSFGFYLFDRNSHVWHAPHRVSFPADKEEYLPQLALSGRGEVLALVEPSQVDANSVPIGNSDVYVFE